MLVDRSVCILIDVENAWRVRRSLSRRGSELGEEDRMDFMNFLRRASTFLRELTKISKYPRLIDRSLVSDTIEYHPYDRTKLSHGITHTFA